MGRSRLILVLLKASRLIDQINEGIGKAISWLTLLMVVVVSIDVLLRYIFSISYLALQEFEWHAFSLVFLLGAGFTLRHNDHVRVDIFYQRLGKRGKAIVNLVGCLVFLFPGCYLIIRTSFPFIYSSWSMHEGSPEPGGLPLRYLLKTAIPIGYMLVGMQGISMFIKNLFILLGIKTDRED